MGDYTITIAARGPHHNTLSEDNGGFGRYVTDPEGGFVSATPELDADKLYRRFVKQLAAAGHSVYHSSFTYGSRE